MTIGGKVTPGVSSSSPSGTIRPVIIEEEEDEKIYPFALVLRLRVLQIVCGISVMVMGTVAFIEERGELNLGLGIPAGAATVLATAMSIHTSRGFGGYRPSSICSRGSQLAQLRFLGPSLRAATPLTALWAAACTLHSALLVHAVATLWHRHDNDSKQIPSESQDSSTSSTSLDDLSDEPGPNVPVLAAIQLCLAMLTLIIVLVVLRVDCLYDPD